MRLSVHDIQRMKNAGERIPMLTAYDYTTAQMVDAAEIPLTLVGDSLGMVVLGYSSTVPVTLDDIVHHARAVVRGSSRTLVVGDLPFLTYTTPEQALRSAGRLLQEAGTQAVKLEGGAALAPTVEQLVRNGVPVMGHLGLTPQSVNLLGHRVQGRSVEGAHRLLDDALALEAAGTFAIVLELVPEPLARLITEHLRIPTIGIGAGAGCSGQVQVIHDILGLYTDFVPKHARRYRSLADEIKAAVGEYADDVRAGTFPGPEHATGIKEDVLTELRQRHETEHR
jgi:3-methyl-2-oxobutanoate hydroxymethyltransferase